jgi:uncharacterized protein YbjT (DUF2867 family)
MSRILVTGGAGVLGHELGVKLERAGYTVRLTSRRPPSNPRSEVEWVQADLETGAGLADAVSGADAIIHAATSPLKHTYRIDVLGTGRLAERARAAGVAHLIYVSIVGVDRIPLDYYRHKLAAEALVQAAGLPWSILRATQFHTFVDNQLQTLARMPIGLLPTDFRFQPIDPGEVADRLVECVAAGPAGRLADLGGPAVRTLGELAQTWLAARGLQRRLVRVPLPGKMADAFRRGFNTIPARTIGNVTWAEWVSRTYNPWPQPIVERDESSGHEWEST